MLRWVIMVVVIVSSHYYVKPLFAYDLNRSINLSGKQRMLTQKMSKEVVLIALDVNRSENLENLKQSHDLFDKTLKGLVHGDDDLQLASTHNKRIVGQLEKVGTLWDPMSKRILEIYNDKAVSDHQFKYVAEHNLPLLMEMNKAVKFYETTASNNNLSPALAKAINVAGRQRMLTQKMSKEFLLISYGFEVHNNQAKIKETKSLFEKKLKALIHGNSSLDIIPAPRHIRMQLEHVESLWQDFKTALEEDPSGISIEIIAELNLPLLREMDKAVGMYEKTLDLM